jgi:hypothetical protein
MGLTGPLPDHLASKIADPEEKKRHGPTWAEAIQHGNHRLELKLHADFNNFLHRHKDQIALVYHANPSRKSTITPGAPDYQILSNSGATCFLEFKVGTNKLSPEQEVIIGRLRKAGFPVLVTGDYDEAIQFAQNYF